MTAQQKVQRVEVGGGGWWQTPPTLGRSYCGGGEKKTGLLTGEKPALLHHSERRMSSATAAETQLVPDWPRPPPVPRLDGARNCQRFIMSSAQVKLLHLQLRSSPVRLPGWLVGRLAFVFSL